MLNALVYYFEAWETHLASKLGPLTAGDNKPANFYENITLIINCIVVCATRIYSQRIIVSRYVTKL